jgi:hypothetical protein
MWPGGHRSLRHDAGPARRVIGQLVRSPTPAPAPSSPPSSPRARAVVGLLRRASPARRCRRRLHFPATLVRPRPPSDRHS